MKRTTTITFLHDGVEVTPQQLIDEGMKRFYADPDLIRCEITRVKRGKGISYVDKALSTVKLPTGFEIHRTGYNEVEFYIYKKIKKPPVIGNYSTGNKILGGV